MADSTLAYDRNEKLPAYGRSGIVEVWLVILPERVIEVYREPHFRVFSREGKNAIYARGIVHKSLISRVLH